MGAESFESSSEQGPKPETELFYNPEVERIPVPRTEAARALTRLAAILLPDKISLEGIDSRHVVDIVDTVVPTTTITQDKENRGRFIESINPILDRLGTTGIGNYLSNPYLTNERVYIRSEDGAVRFNGLFIPWQYGDSTAINMIDMKN